MTKSWYVFFRKDVHIKLNNSTLVNKKWNLQKSINKQVDQLKVDQQQSWPTKS